MNKDGGNLLDGKKVGEALSGLANNFGKFTANVADQAKNAVSKSQESVLTCAPVKIYRGEAYEH